MEFLVIIVALWLHHMLPDLGWIQQDGWYRKWIASMKGDNQQLIRFLAILALPVVVLLLILASVDYFGNGLLKFVVELLGMFYVLGRGDLVSRFEKLEIDFSRNDFQAAYHDVEELHLNNYAANAQTKEEFQRDLLETLSYRFFEHAFPVIFWFALLGLPGALLYRLTQLYTETSGLEESQLDRGERWLWLLEWLPARLLGLTFALVGNFASCFQRWRECFFCGVRTTPNVLAHYVEGALTMDLQADVSGAGVTDLEMVKQLFYRALTLWVCVIALLLVF